MTVALQERQCANCPVRFTPARRDARYCSAACRAAAARARSDLNANRTRTDIHVGAVVPVRPAAAAVVVWEPVSGRRGPRPTTEPCPACGAGLHASPRGTLRVCMACHPHRKVTPPGVCAPWQREAGQTRQITTQAERDAASKTLHLRRGVLTRELQALLDRDLSDESRDITGWYLSEVAEAKTMSRLDELVTQFADERIRPRRWWHPDPPEVAALAWPDDEGQADDDDYPPVLIHARRAAAVVMMPHEWPRGWSMSEPRPDGRCQVRHVHEGQCTEPGDRSVPLARVCEAHYQALRAAS